MAFTYDNNLFTVKDLVRFLVGDVSSENFEFTDEEIQASITLRQGEGFSDKTVAHLTAADLLSNLLARWNVQSKGVTQKTLGKSTFNLGGSSVTITSITDRICNLRERAAEFTIPIQKRAIKVFRFS